VGTLIFGEMKTCFTLGIKVYSFCTDASNVLSLTEFREVGLIWMPWWLTTWNIAGFRVIRWAEVLLCPKPNCKESDLFVK
jgi:hypothetical protein